MDALIQDLVDAISLGSLYALLALGVALIYGIMGLVNFAHGELIMVGAYAVLLLSGPPAVIVLLATVGIVVFVALAMDRVAFRPVRGADPATLLVTSFAVSILLQSIVRFTQGSQSKGVDLLPSLQQTLSIGDIRIQRLNLVIIITTVVLVAALGIFLKRTSIGIQMRAAAENFQAARLMGVKADRVIATAFAISGLLAGTAAIFLIAQGGVAFPTIGLAPVIIAFVAVIVGGLYSLRGAVIGAFVLGFLTIALQSWLPSGLTPYRDAFVYSVVLIILLVRPEGIVVARALRGRIG